MENVTRVKCFHGMVRSGPVRSGSVTALFLLSSAHVCIFHWPGPVRSGTVRSGTVRSGTVRYGTVRYGTVRYGLIGDQNGIVLFRVG